MNRLWVRLSISFAAVIFLSTSILVLVSILLADTTLATRLMEATGPSRTPGTFVQRAPGFVRRVAMFGFILGIPAGIVVSRLLTAPLSDLVQAARVIGAGDLSHRVPVRGSDEFVEVGQAFNRMAAQLQEAEEQRRGLVADVAHELRGPITVLNGNLRALLDDVYPLTKAEVATLYDQTHTLSRIIDDLHDLAQADAHQLTLQRDLVHIKPLIQSAVDMFAPLAASQNIMLHADIAVGLPPLNADSARLSQVLNNLISNAIRHTPAGGTITLRATATDRTVGIAVSDTGEGIAFTELDHIFKRFYRVDRSRTRGTGGSGLGLAIVKAIAEAHGGTVSAHSRGPGHGATFIVRLPHSVEVAEGGHSDTQSQA